MTQEMVGGMIRQFRVTLSHLQLYASSSAMVQESSKQLLTMMEEEWKEIPEIMFAESDRQLLVNGQRYLWKGPDAVASEAIATRLQTHHVKSVGFKPGASVEELVGFLELLGRKPGNGPDAIGPLMAAKNMSHIVLNEKVYVVAGEETPPVPPVSPVPPDPASPPGGVSVTLSAEQVAKLQQVLESAPSKPLSPIETAKGLLQQDAGSLLHDDTVKSLPDMLKNLDQLEQPQLAGEVVDKLATNFASTDADVRLKTARSFKSVTPAVEALSDKKIIDRLEDRFIEAGEKESAKPVYLELADLLEHGADRVLGEGNYEKTVRIVGMFRHHTATKDAGFIDRWMCAQKALERIANRHAIEILVTDLREDNSAKRDQAYTVIMKLADAALTELIDAIQETEDMHLRRVIAYAIKNIGEDAVKTYLGSISQVTNPEGGKRLVETLEGLGLGNDQLAEALGKTFVQCHPAVKMEILRVLTRMRVAGAEAVIDQALEDGDRRVRMTAIEMAGKLPAKTLVKKLLPLIAFQSRFGGHDEDDEIQETCCRALGSLGDPQAVLTLTEVAGPASFMKRTKSEPVRCAAVLALGEYASEEGKRAVETFVKAKELAIRQAAEQAKRRQATRAQKKGDRLAATVL